MLRHGITGTRQAFRGIIPRSRRALLLRALWMVVCALFGTPWSSAQAQQFHDEARVKAAFLLRFVQYVEWPREVLPSAGAPVRIGVIGAPEIADELMQTVAVRSGKPRPLVVQSVRNAESLAQFQVIFIGADEQENIPRYVNAVRGKPILVVTETPGALEQGSMINFVIVDQHVKFEIAVGAAERAALTLSSRLLAVAVRVHKGALAHTGALARLNQTFYEVVPYRRAQRAAIWNP